MEKVEEESEGEVDLELAAMTKTLGANRIRNDIALSLSLSRFFLRQAASFCYNLYTLYMNEIH